MISESFMVFKDYDCSRMIDHSLSLIEKNLGSFRPPNIRNENQIDKQTMI